MSFTGFSNQPPPLNLSKREKDTITDEFLTTPCLRCGDDSHACSDCSNNDLLSSGRVFGELTQPGKRRTANKMIGKLQDLYKSDPNSPQLRKARENRAAQQKAMGHDQPPVPIPTHDSKPPIDTGLESSSIASNTGRGSQALGDAPDLSSPGDGERPQEDVADPPRPSSGAGSGGDSKTFNYEFPHDLKEDTVQSSPTAADLRNQARVPERDTKDTYMGRLKDMVLDYPVRDQLAKNGEAVTVLTNHFQLLYNTKKPIVLYEFRVNELENKAKRKARAMMESIVTNCAVLRDNRASFATDYFCTIVAWVDLRTLFDQANPDGTHHLLNIRDGPLDLRMNLRFERQVDMQDLLRYAEINTAAVANPTEYIETMTNFFNIIISECAERSSVGTIPGGGNKFYRKDAHAGLGSDSLCTHRGYSYSVKAGVGAVLLNVNTLNSAFWRPVNLASVMDDDRTWGDVDWNTFSGLIAGLRVYILYNRGDKKKDPASYERLNSEKGRTKTIVGLGEIPSSQGFKVEPGKTTTVEQHFLAHYHQRLNFPHLPVVNLGSRQQPIWYPAEKLQILAYQKFKGLVPSQLISSIQKIACQKPPIAKALVALEGLETLGATRNMNNPFQLPTCSMFSLRPFLLRVDGVMLKAPTICYSGETVSSVGGNWVFIKKKFYQCKDKVFNAQVVHEGHVNKDHANEIANHLVKWTGKYNVARVDISKTGVVFYDNSPKKMIEALNKRENSATMAILILGRKNISTYSTFKDLCDRKYGLHAICLTRAKCQNGEQGSTWGNIALKMNLKSGGINHTVNGNVIRPEGEVMKSILLLGADVTHPGPGSVPGCPSIAAIVGSVDCFAGRFLGSMRLQNTPRAEIIDEVKDMVSERIEDWIEEMSPRNAKYLTLPEVIIYYRDGVSESMYAEVKRVEIKAIRDAFNAVLDKYTREKRINPSAPVKNVRIVAIICGKRHHVRFYPSDDRQADHTQNCLPGTAVDDVVTSPYYQDFYLQSHKAIIGTARPAHYFIIENESKMSMADLRLFTHQLCYTYVRAPVGVSYAAPAYYADRLCERGRCYLRGFFVAPKGSDVRKDYDTKRDQEEFKLKPKPDPKRDPEKSKNPDSKEVSKRSKKTQEMVNKEKEDALTVRKSCDKYIMGQARKAFEEYNKGGNPWHRNLNKTMFWM